MVRGGANLQLTVPQLFSESQRVTSLNGLLRYARVFWELYEEDATATFEQLWACVKWILQEEKNTYTDRLVRFTGVLVSLVEEEEEAQLELVDALLKQLVDVSDAADHAVRWRACQLLQAVMENLPEEGIPDDCIEAVEKAMLDRLDDAKPAVRAAAARALKRLPHPGEDGDYEDCPVTQALLEALSGDKNKEVRKAVLASLPLLLVDPSEGPMVSPCTIPHVLERTLDEADEVRKVAYLALKIQVPLKALGLEDRLLVLRRGLTDRQQAVADAAALLLHKWLSDCCGADVLLLLSELDVVQHAEEAETVVKALITSGGLNTVELCKNAAEAGEGLQRDFSQEDALLSPAEALLWRVVCTELYADANSKGLAAAAAAGAAASIEAAAAGDRYLALEGALPASTEDMAAIIGRHAQAGEEHRFATCQLMLLASTCMDFADATSRKAAASTLHSLLTNVPSGEGAAGCGGEGAAGCGGEQLGSAWRQALGQFLIKVHADPLELAESLLPTVGQLCAAAEQGGAPAAWLQTLAATSLLLDWLAPDARPARRAAVEFTLEDVLHRVIMPAMRQDDVQVQREAVRCLGLYSTLDGITTSLASHVEVLRSAVMAWQPTGTTADVATVAAQALGDLALQRGIKHLDSFLETGAPAEPANPTLDPELCQRPLLDLLLGVLQSWEGSLETMLAKAQRKNGDAADVPAKLQLGAAIAEGLARLVLHNNSWSARAASTGHLGLENCEVLQVLVRLLMLNFDPVAEPATQLRQCLAVFFDTYARMPLPREMPDPHDTPPCSHAYLSSVLLEAAHCAVERELAGGKRITATNCMSAKVMRFVLQLLESPVKGPNGEEEQVGHEALAKSILAEVIQCCGLAAPKPYLATLCKLPLRLPIMMATPETKDTIKAVRALAERAHELLADRIMRKDMEAVMERFARLDSSPAEPLSKEEIAMLLDSIQQQGEGESDCQLPFEAADAVTGGRAPATAARGKTPARGRGRRKAESSSEGEDDEQADGEQEEAEQPKRRGNAVAAATTASRRMPARSTRVTRKLVEASEESDSESSEASDSENEEEEYENVSAAAAKGKARRASSDGVSAVRQALQENRIS